MLNVVLAVLLLFDPINLQSNQDTANSPFDVAWLASKARNEWRALEEALARRPGIEYRVNSEHEIMYPQGLHQWFEDNRTFCWSVREIEDNSWKHVVSSSNKYSFVLKKVNNALQQIQLTNQTSHTRSAASALQSSLGAQSRFLALPDIGILPSSLALFFEEATCESITKNDDRRIAFRFTIDTAKLSEKGIKLAKSPGGTAEEKAFYMLLARGVHTLEVELEPTSGRLLACSTELKFKREAITLETIRAANAAGQRRPDGSPIPESLAEKPGEIFEEVGGMRVEWEYNKDDSSLLVGVICRKVKSDLPLSVPGAYAIQDIKFLDVIDKAAFELKHYGMPEPTDDNGFSFFSVFWQRLDLIGWGVLSVGVAGLIFVIFKKPKGNQAKPLKLPN